MKASENDTRQDGSGSFTDNRPTSTVSIAIPTHARFSGPKPDSTVLRTLLASTATPAAATTPMYRLPFMASLLGSIGLPFIEQPPDETGVLEAPYEAAVEASVASDSPDETGGADVKEVVRDQPVVPDQPRGVQALRPDQAAGLRRARAPGHVIPLAVAAEHHVIAGEQAVEVGDAHAPGVETVRASPDERLGVGPLLLGEHRIAAQAAKAPDEPLAPGEGLAGDGRLGAGQAEEVQLLADRDCVRILAEGSRQPDGAVDVQHPGPLLEEVR